MPSVSYTLLLALSQVLQLVLCIPQGALLSSDLRRLGKLMDLMQWLSSPSHNPVNFCNQRQLPQTRQVQQPQLQLAVLATLLPM